MLSQNAGDSRAKNTGGTPLKCWCKVATCTLRILQWKFVHSTTNVHNKSRPNLPKAAPATQSHAAPCFPFFSFSLRLLFFLSCDLLFLLLFLSVTLLFCDCFFAIYTLSLCYIPFLFFLAVTFPFACILIPSPTFSFWLSSWFLKVHISPGSRSNQTSSWIFPEFLLTSIETDRFNHNQIISLSASCFLIPYFQFSTPARILVPGPPQNRISDQPSC